MSVRSFRQDRARGPGVLHFAQIDAASRWLLTASRGDVVTSPADPHPGTECSPRCRNLAREVLTSSGALDLIAPEVNDRRVDVATGERARFSLAVLGCGAASRVGIRPGAVGAHRPV